MLMENASKVMQNVAANIDDDILSPSISRLYDMVMLTQGEKKVLRGDEHIRVRGVTVAIQRETDRMRKLEFLQMTANPIDMSIIGPEGRATVLRDVSEELGMRGEDIVPSDIELKQKKMAQEKAAAEQKQMEAEQAAQGGAGTQGPKPQPPRSPEMQVREPQENVTRGMT